MRLTEEELSALLANRQTRTARAVETEVKPKRATKQQPEYKLHCEIVQYLNFKYPEVLFMSDLDNQIYLKPQQAARNARLQKQGFSCPDLIIFNPKRQFPLPTICGLLLEIKGQTIYKKDGETLLKNDHVDKQIESIEKLKRLGYEAHIVWEFEQAKTIIDQYLGASGAAESVSNKME